MKPGLRREDLKAPPAKHRRTASSASNAGTPVGRSPAAQSLAAANANGTGASYASPIAVDSPSPQRSNGVSADAMATSMQRQGSDQKPKSRPRKALVDAKMAGKSKGSPASNGPTPVNGDTPMLPAGLPSGASPLPFVSAAPTPEMQQLAQQRQAMSLKRKRELEEAESDPVAFSERMLAGLAKPDNAVAQPSIPNLGFEDFLGAELRALFEDVPPPAVAPLAAVAAPLTLQMPNAIDSPFEFVDFDGLWDNNSATATPDMLMLDDPTKTSPPDDVVATPADAAGKAAAADFDTEFNRLFGPKKAIQPPSVPIMAWNWATGPTTAV